MIINDDEDRFQNEFNNLSETIHKMAVAKGFWEDGKNRNEAEQIALIHSELSEALENIREGKVPSDKIPAYKGVEEELADAIIRIMDYSFGNNYDISGAILAKIRYNNTRGYKHGKMF